MSIASPTSPCTSTRSSSAIASSKGVGHSGVLPVGLFHVGAGAHDASDRIIYDPVNGFLIYDGNGNHPGGATHFATLMPHLALTHADFLIYEMPIE